LNLGIDLQGRSTMTRILVTGGAGFLGSHLCTRLVEAGHQVICLDNLYTGRHENVAHLLGPGSAGRFELVRHDVVEPYYAEVDQIYHLACPASPVHYQRNPVRTLKTAVLGTLNVLELALATGARVLLASTSEIYGEPEMHPQREEYWGHANPVGARACYDEGKRCGEALVASYVAQHQLSARVARIFNTYGPRMQEDDGRVVSNFITQALAGQPLTIYGDGAQTRSLCYVSDLINGILALMSCETDPGPVNLGNPEEMTVREIAELILELTGSSSRLVRRPLPPDDPTRRCPDISKARARLAWSPLVSAREGVARTIAYFASRRPAVRGNGHAHATQATDTDALLGT
jgi:UDP-glucuronate decarboxylase